jgi:hypothetical protein
MAAYSNLNLIKYASILQSNNSPKWILVMDQEYGLQQDFEGFAISSKIGPFKIKEPIKIIEPIIPFSRTRAIILIYLKPLEILLESPCSSIKANRFHPE